MKTAFLAPVDWGQFVMNKKYEHSNAGPAARYTAPSSPFIFANGFLREVRLQNLISFLSQNQPSPEEAYVLIAGVRAAIMCPNKIVRTKNRNWPERTSTFLVQAAMCREASRFLSSTLNQVRKSQLNTRKWSVEKLLGDFRLQRFPWDVFFAVGAVDPSLPKIGDEEFVAHFGNQQRQIIAAAAVMHALHSRCHQREQQKGTDWRWGMNDAYKWAANVLQHIIASPTKHRSARPAKLSSKENVTKPKQMLGQNHNAPSLEGTMKNHWAAMKPSGPLIYAASLLDDGRVFKWLLNGSDNDAFESDLRNEALIVEWFEVADAVASTLNGAGLWEKLTGNLRPLPPPRQDKEFSLYLKAALAE
jgi:hypothetical protein